MAPANQPVDESFVRRIARLARLDLGDHEVEPLSRDLKNILEYIQKLEELDVSEVDALSHVHGENNRFREDIVFNVKSASEEELERHQQVKARIIENIPDRSGNFIKVPLIIDQESS